MLTNPPQTKLVFILVGARRRVGKDTFANLLCGEIKKSGFPVFSKSFAGALKDEVTRALLSSHHWPADLSGWSDEPEIKEKVIRPLLIAWGNGRRHFNENHWVDRVVDSSRQMRDQYVEACLKDSELPKPYYFIVVSDWRFPNEIARIRGPLGDKVFGIHMIRHGAPEGTPDEIINDPLCQKVADLYVSNEGSIEDLRSTADIIFRNTIQTQLYFHQ